MIKRLANPECITALFDGVFAVALTIGRKSRSAAQGAIRCVA
jgi:hypothetical protein